MGWDHMVKRTALLFFVSIATSLTSSAQDAVPQSAWATALKGRWVFTSSVTGRGHRGDIDVKLRPPDTRGVQVGKISYDGQQTNDRCSTKAGFTSDYPVDVESVRTGDKYFLKFALNCQSARARDGLSGNSCEARTVLGQWTEMPATVLV